LPVSSKTKALFNCRHSEQFYEEEKSVDRHENLAIPTAMFADVEGLSVERI